MNRDNTQQLNNDNANVNMHGVRLRMYVNDGDLSCSLHRVAWISIFFAHIEDQ